MSDQPIKPKRPARPFPAMEMLPLPDYILDTAIDVYPTGSRATCPEAVFDSSDHDWLVLVHDKNKYGADLVSRGAEDLVAKALTRLGAPLAYYTDNQFNSYMLDKLNVIVIDNEHFFNTFKIATQMAFRLQLFNKGDRIALFEAINFSRFPLFMPIDHRTRGGYLAEMRATQGDKP